MKTIKEQIKLKYLLLHTVVLFIILYVTYRYLKPLVENTASLSMVFFFLGLSLFFMSIVVFYYLKKQNEQLIEDVDELSEHILDISNKDYRANITIKYYSEFLQISLALKNIIKRLVK